MLHCCIFHWDVVTVFNGSNTNHCTLGIPQLRAFYPWESRWMKGKRSNCGTKKKQMLGEQRSSGKKRSIKFFWKNTQLIFWTCNLFTYDIIYFFVFNILVLVLSYFCPWSITFLLMSCKYWNVKKRLPNEMAEDRTNLLWNFRWIILSILNFFPRLYPSCQQLFLLLPYTFFHERRCTMAKSSLWSFFVCFVNINSYKNFNFTKQSCSPVCPNEFKIKPYNSKPPNSEHAAIELKPKWHQIGYI